MSERIQPGTGVSTHLDADQLNAFLERALPEHEYLLTLAHLAECPDCREVVFLAQDAAPEMEPQIVRTEPAPESKWSWRRWFTPFPLAGAAAFAAMLLIFVAWRHRPTHRMMEQEGARQTTSAPQPEEHAALRAPAPPPQASMQAAPQKIEKERASVSEDGIRPDVPIAPAAQPKAVPKQADVNAEQAPIAAMQKEQALAGMTAGAAAPASGQLENRQRMYQAAPAPPRAQPPAAPMLPPPSTVAPAPPAVASESRDAAAFTANASALPSIVARSAPSRPASELSSVSGRVTDASGATIQGAAVTLHFAAGSSAGTNDVQATTGQDGRFALPAVAPGKYDLKIVSPGFEASSQQVELQPHASVQLQPVLTVGAAAETVEVSSDAAFVESKAARSNSKLTAPSSLPSGLPGVATAVAGGTTLTLDSSGNLFEKHGAHKWKQITATWTGKAIQVRTIPGQSDGFQLTTDAGATWVSADGERWRQIKYSSVP